MYNTCDMKKVIMGCLFVLSVLSVWAAQPVALSLPPVMHADTEVVTNVSFTAGSRIAGRFVVALSCLATPTNNVEAAFGVDADGDGVLSLEEMELRIGWNCGVWFVRAGADAERITFVPSATNVVKSLVWSMRLDRASRPTGFSLTPDGEQAFPSLVDVQDIPYNPAWNLVRLTGRGLDVQDETFRVQIQSEGFSIFMR